MAYTYLSLWLAVWYWRLQRLLGLPPAHGTNLTRVQDEAWRASDIGAADLEWTKLTVHQANSAGILLDEDLLAQAAQSPDGTIGWPGPIDVLVSQRGHRSGAGPYHRHLFLTGVPEGSFCKVGPNVIVPSPELTLALMMPLLGTDAERAMLVYEFCGEYAELPRGMRTVEGFGFVRRPHLTTVEKCQAFAEATSLRGKAIFLRVLNNVANNSYSPQESKTHYLLCSREGFGIPCAGLNQKVALSPAWRRVVGKPYVRGDLMFKNRQWRPGTDRCKGLLLEYQGRVAHYDSELGGRQATDDNRRRRALEDEGWVVLYVTAGEFHSFDDVVAMARQVVRVVGCHPSWLDDTERLLRIRKLHALLQDPDLGRL